MDLLFVFPTRLLATATTGCSKLPDVSEMLRVRARVRILISLRTTMVCGVFYSPVIMEAKAFAPNYSTSRWWRKALKANLVVLNDVFFTNKRRGLPLVQARVCPPIFY